MAEVVPSPNAGEPAVPVLPDVLTVDEAADLLRIGRQAMYDAIGRGEVPHRRIGKSIRLSRAGLLQWLTGGAT